MTTRQPVRPPTPYRPRCDVRYLHEGPIDHPADRTARPHESRRCARNSLGPDVAVQAKKRAVHSTPTSHFRPAGRLDEWLQAWLSRTNHNSSSTTTDAMTRTSVSRQPIRH